MTSVAKGASARSFELPAASLPVPDDRRLSKRAVRGDRKAFDAIFRRHHRDLYRYCRAILGDPQEAEDALQSTMVKAMRALPGEKREVALRPWLFRVAHNEAIGQLRARRTPLELGAEQIDTRGGVVESAETRERIRNLVSDLGQLPERQRGALVMRELNGLSFADIGATFGISEVAAKQTVYEARTSLHRMAEGREMECDPVREAISAADRRRLRSRKIRAHLRECASCRMFERGISQRRADLAILAPPLALPAAIAAIKGSIGGGGSAATGITAGGAATSGGGAAGVAVAAKSAAAVLTAIALAGGAAEFSGLTSLGDSGDDRIDASRSGDGEGASTSGQYAIPAAADHPLPSLYAPESAARGDQRTIGGPGSPPDAGARPEQRAGDQAAGTVTRSDAPPGQAATPPGQAATPPGQASAPPGQGATPPGQAATPPGQASAPPGQTVTPPGQARTPPGQSDDPGSSSPPGQSRVPPGQAETPPGQAETPPGQAETPPGQSSTPPGQSGTAPGQSGTPPGHGGTPPGHGGTPPGQAQTPAG